MQGSIVCTTNPHCLPVLKLPHPPQWPSLWRRSGLWILLHQDHINFLSSDRPSADHSEGEHSRSSSKEVSDGRRWTLFILEARTQTQAAPEAGVETTIVPITRMANGTFRGRQPPSDLQSHPPYPWRSPHRAAQGSPCRLTGRASELSSGPRAREHHRAHESAHGGTRGGRALAPDVCEGGVLTAKA